MRAWSFFLLCVFFFTWMDTERERERECLWKKDRDNACEYWENQNSWKAKEKGDVWVANGL